MAAMTDREVASLPPEPQLYVRSLGKSMFVKVQPNGSKYIVWQYRFHGARRNFHLGTYGKAPGQIRLKEAREIRDRMEVRRRAGEDPDPKVKSRNGISVDGTAKFSIVADKWIASAVKRLAETTMKDYKNRVHNQLCPVFGEQQIGSITRAECIEYKENIDSRGAVVQAKKNFKILEQILTFAMDREYMQEKLNPARNCGDLNIKRAVRHSPMLSFEELPKFLVQLSRNELNRNWTIVNSLKVILLTFQRVGALIPARWEEIDIEKQMWTIPLERVKKSGLSADHLVPISDPLVHVLLRLRELNPHSDYVFPRCGDYGISTGNKDPHINRSAPNRLLKDMGYEGKLVSHGIRAMAATIGQEQLNVPYHIIDIQLAHKPGTSQSNRSVRQAYDRAVFLEERIDLMERWGALLVENGLEAFDDWLEERV